MRDPMREMIAKRKRGIHCGIPSYCTANSIVIEAILSQAKRFDDCVLIEATANQVNQYGGYTNMSPSDFRDFVYEIAEKVDFPKESVILGGDHLGPLIWADEPEEEAMRKAEELVRLFVKAGYKKIHLDTSMRLGDDPKDEPLADSTIARRGARLYAACEQAYLKQKESNAEEVRPVYIVGSEVPIPGGAREEEIVTVTSAESVKSTIGEYQRQFEEMGLNDAFDNIVGLVVQPGVEFGDAQILHYDRNKAKSLCDFLEKYDTLVLEGHSTDYQSPVHLRQMVEDGIAILKVGPALTFTLREALFSLSMIEEELITQAERANFKNVLDEVMLQEPKSWEKHYYGTKEQVAVKRKYSFSDRCRYYFSRAEVVDAIDKLFDNLKNVDIPLSMIRQYMPIQYSKIRDGKLKKDVVEIAKDNIVTLVDHYNYAVKSHYIISDIFI